MVSSPFRMCGCRGQIGEDEAKIEADIRERERKHAERAQLGELSGVNAALVRLLQVMPSGCASEAMLWA